MQYEGCRPLRRCISNDDGEYVLFAVDVIAQPHYRSEYLQYDPHVHAKCSRALPAALPGDVVVLTGSLDRAYYEWLRGFGIGPDHVVELRREGTRASLSELILDHPEPVARVLRRLGDRRPVYVPFYSGENERRAAELLGADLFGCDESIILKYFNKESFKRECGRLGIEIVGGTNAKASHQDPLTQQELEEIVLSLLTNYPRLIIRGAEGSAGSSLYTVDSGNIDDVYRQIRANHETSLLVEPFLKVIASPNDQWVLARDGEIHHLGLSTQLFEGLKHVGNLKGQYLSPRIEQYIHRASTIIVEEMARHDYRGVVGIDYIVAREGIFPVENNARMNGSSFTLAIVDNLETRHGPVASWKFFRASTEPCTFEELVRRIEPVMYDGSGINCVFPYDCDTLPENGKFTPVILAEDMFHVDYLERALGELGVVKL